MITLLCEHDNFETLEEIYKQRGESLSVVQCKSCGCVFKYRYQYDEGSGSDSFIVYPGEEERGISFPIKEFVGILVEHKEKIGYKKWLDYENWIDPHGIAMKEVSGTVVELNTIRFYLAKLLKNFGIDKEDQMKYSFGRDYWANQYLGDFPQHRNYAWRAAVTYYHYANKFDRQFPGKEFKGKWYWMPRNPADLKLCREHARALERALSFFARRNGVSRTDIRKAMREAAKYDFRDMEREIGRMWEREDE